MNYENVIYFKCVKNTEFKYGNQYIYMCVQICHSVSMLKKNVSILVMQQNLLKW